MSDMSITAGAEVAALRLPAEPIKKRSIIIAGHKTSLAMEDVFWTELRAIARDRGVRLHRLVAEIAAAADGHNLSSKLRVFVLRHALKHGPAGAGDR